MDSTLETQKGQGTHAATSLSRDDGRLSAKYKDTPTMPNKATTTSDLRSFHGFSTPRSLDRTIINQTTSDNGDLLLYRQRKTSKSVAGLISVTGRQRNTSPTYNNISKKDDDPLINISQNEHGHVRSRKNITKTTSKSHGSKKSAMNDKLQIEKMFLKKRHELELLQLEQEKQLELAKLDEVETSDDDNCVSGYNSDVSSQYQTQLRLLNITSKNRTKMWLETQQRNTPLDDKTCEKDKQIVDEQFMMNNATEGNVRQNETTNGNNQTTNGNKVCHLNNIHQNAEVKQNTERDINLRDLIVRQSIPCELPPFSGEPLDWPIFISEFKNTTQTCNFSNHENLIRLRKCLSGRAKESVQSLLILPNNVNKIIETLQTRFGNPTHIVRHSIDKIKNVPSVRDDKIDILLKFFDTLTNLIHNLESLNEIDHIRNPILFEEILNKFPMNKRIAFLQYYNTLSYPGPKLIVFHEWLSRQVNVISQLMPSVSHDDDKYKTKGARPKDLTLTTTTTVIPKKQDKTYYCNYCNENDHSIYSCDKFKKLTTDDRWQFVTSNSLCISCLGKYHTSKTCKRRQNCNIDKCQRPHNKLLHKTEINKDDIPKGDNSDQVDKNCNVNDIKRGRVLLKVIPVVIKGPNKSVRTYALLDDASTVSLIDQNLSEQLGLDGPMKPLRIQWTNEQVKEQEDSKIVSLSISGSQDNSKPYLLRNVKTISGLSLPTQCVDVDILQCSAQFLKNFKHLSFTNARPLILIGQDNWHVIVTLKSIYGHWNGPVVSKTRLGWVIHGNTTNSVSNEADHTHLTTEECMFHVYDNLPDLDEKDDLSILHDLVKSQWKLDADNSSTKDIEVSKDDKRCVDIMTQTIRRVSDDKFECGLLWKSDDFQLPKSYTMALNRLYHLESKMDKNPEYAKIYCAKFNDYVRKGYLKKLTPDEKTLTTNKTFYLPHFGVVNPNKPEKLRIVFDAAAKANGHSLNDFLLTGPDLYNSLPTILMNFRKNPIAFVGDIQEMFLQIGVRQDDRHAQRILWREMNRDKPPDIFEIQVVFFGAKSSPSLSQEVKNKNALEFKDQYPKASEDIISRHYMDDYLGGANSVDEAVQMINDVITVHSKAGFNMTNWICNSNEVLVHINPELQTTKSEKLLDTDKEERVLGLWWDYEKDVYAYRFKFHKINPTILQLERRPTKRELLKVVMSMFDPLGFISNYLIVGRILLQSVWDCGIAWDDELPDEQFDLWKNWISKVHILTNINIPRKITTFDISSCDIQLHIFCDASKYAYASCAYLRFENDGQIQCNLILAKAHVAPLKPATIPRLELQSALLGSRLLKNIRENLDVPIHKVQLWSDSEIVLSWIRTSSRRFKVYVAQRISEIHDNTNVSDWKYVPSKLNIADDATKVKPIDFSNDSPWLTGPRFLYENSDKWPQKNFLHTNIMENQDVNEYVNLTTESIEFAIPDVTRFSKWYRYLRSTAWILKFIGMIVLNLKRGTFEELQPEELRRAEILIYRRIQHDCYPEELNCLMKKQTLPKNSQLSSFKIMIDDDSLIRLKGRMANVDDDNFDYNSKHPIVLSHRHPIAKLIIQHYHERNSHIGHDKVITDLRNIYWITSGRNAVKNVANDCQYCKNKRAKPQIPLMGQLPSCRVNVTSRPFIRTGVDYFGPYEVSVNRRLEKRYGVLFTCMATRAVHLEIANDLSSNAFIHAWRQFGCRRGFPEELFSDNGTNFQKANKEISEAIRDWPHAEISREMTMKNCRWTFNPPAAPHMGGAWERLIKSAKSHLSFLLKERHPKEYVLKTLFCEIENILNSRPLTNVPLTSDDAPPLTPNDLLIGPSHSSLQFVNTTDKDVHFLNMWKATQRLSDIFWNRWRKEYRQYLLCSSKWKKECPNLEKGDVVLIIDPNAMRNIWPKGIIENTYPSKDGQVRVVDVRTVSGIYRRPVHKLIKLDVEK